MLFVTLGCVQVDNWCTVWFDRNIRVNCFSYTIWVEYVHKELFYNIIYFISFEWFFQNIKFCICTCAAEAGQSALDSEAKSNEIGGIERKSTRVWAMNTGYDPEKLFNKVIFSLFTYLFFAHAWIFLSPDFIDLHWVQHIDTIPFSLKEIACLCTKALGLIQVK